ncbi:MAG: response regulator [Pikeienuella sp.]
MSERPRILIVEDDPEIRALTRDYLEAQGFRVDAVEGAAALDRRLTQGPEPDLLVLDVMLPGEDGLSICRRLRANSTLPVLMLTARGDDVDRILGLEMGADDYMAKPFNPRELVARIRAILRRTEIRRPPHRRLQAGPLIIDLEARRVDGPDGEIPLTGAEFDLLACFLLRPGRVLSRERLMDWTRGREAGPLDRTIDVQISRLRKKIERSDQPLVKTVRSAGYILAVPVAPITETLGGSAGVADRAADGTADGPGEPAV